MAGAEMEQLTPEALKRIAARFRLLANPTRLALLRQICERELTVSEIVEATGFKQANVSKQLGLLDRGGVVRRRVAGNNVWYVVADPLLPDLCRLVTESFAAEG